jgi:integrase
VYEGRPQIAYAELLDLRKSDRASDVKHASELCKNYIRPAGEKLGLEKIGRHTFRHTCRTLLDESGAPMKVQQELMRHANIQTTMNVYGSAMLESKRTANSKIVRMVLVPSVRGKEKGRASAAS